MALCAIPPHIPSAIVTAAEAATLLCASCASSIVALRIRARRNRRYTRLRVVPYRGDDPPIAGIVSMYEALHKRLLRRWWRRLLAGQPSIGLELHCDLGAWFSLTCPAGTESIVEAALRSAYPNCRLRSAPCAPGIPPYVLRLKKHSSFTKRSKRLDRFEHDRAPTANRLITTMAACKEPAFVQLALTPTPALFEGHSKRSYKRYEHHLSRARKLRVPPLDPSKVENEELIGGLDIQHRPLFFADIRVIGPNRAVCERVASELRACGAENRLVERGTGLRHGRLGLYTKRIQRAEGNPLPSPRKGVFASTELATLWHLPSPDYATVPLARDPLPVAPAPLAILRPSEGFGSLRDAQGPVSIHPRMRRQNTAVPGTVEQGKSSYLVATVAEDLLRERCAVIVFDPKGDAAEAAVSLVPRERTCTLLDFAHPTCGFNPLDVDAPADTIADYVVASLKQLFSEGDIKASSDRYLRNAIIAVLAYDRSSTLWDAARLLSVGEEGYAYRTRVAASLRSQPEFKEISEFFTGELAVQLADARGTTTAKLDAPVNKLARLLNSPSIKRVLLNASLRVDFEEVISDGQVLVVKGALGAMGSGNTSVLMQLLVGMLDAALARRQDGIPAAERTAVALKIDEAPLVVNRGFAETLALKRSAGLETVACWQTDAQWIDRDVRAQLDALFAHRVYFATASVEDARKAANLMMAEFSDTVRPGIRNLSDLGRPDVRLHLPRHSALASWVTPEGRQAPFVAHTLPLPFDEQRLAFHAARQAERGGRFLEDLSQPHWLRQEPREMSAPVQPPESSKQISALSGPVEPVESTEPVNSTGPVKFAGPINSARSVESALSSDASTSHSQSIESYTELVDLDAAHSVRWAKLVTALLAIEPEPLDIEILTLIASMRHVLSSQIHRRFNPGRAATTTQRRLKRLADAGLVARFQFHRRDGGGIPMCYTITPAGLQLVREQDTPQGRESIEDLGGRHQRVSPNDERLLRQARHEVHVVAWMLALRQALPNDDPVKLRGPEESAIVPPLHSRDGERKMLRLSELSLPGGRTPHDFLRTLDPGIRVEVESFQTIRPDASLCTGDGRELLVELDDRLPEGSGAGKLERYDHFLAGWSVHLKRYKRSAVNSPTVVFVCRDGARARECARRADRVLTACRAYPGEYPADWEYPGRDRVFYAAERDIHYGSLLAWGLSRLPPEVRVVAAGGDPRARDPSLEAQKLGL